jgi:hypothetical protein
MYHQTLEPIVRPRTCRQRIAEILEAHGIDSWKEFENRIGLSKDSYYRIVYDDPAQVEFDTIMTIGMMLALRFAVVMELLNLGGHPFPNSSDLHDAYTEILTHEAHLSYSEKLTKLESASASDTIKQEIYKETIKQERRERRIQK